MLGIDGIGAVTGSSGPVPTDKKARERAQSRPPETDAVTFTTEAVQAADATRLVREAEKIAQDEHQQKRIEEAKRNIQEGAYRVQSIVLEIAGRITGLVN